MIECSIAQNLADCFALRQAVFCDEQGFVEEFDEFDDHPHTAHTLLTVDDCPVGCARYLIESDAQGPYLRAGRIAVAAAQRGRGLGRILMQRSIPLACAYLLSTCPEKMAQVTQVRLHSQIDKVGFYERCGFVAMDVPPDEEEGVPHQWMACSIKPYLDQNRKK